MCRMLFAIGDFSTEALMDAAVAMSVGITGDHDHPITSFADGWGAMWLNECDESHIEVHRDTRFVADSAWDAPFVGQKTRFLAIHLRNASVPQNRGIQFTHPISKRGTSVPWYLCHHGFLPSLYRELGMERSYFDSAEYFDYIVPKDSAVLDRRAVLAKLDRLPPDSISANAIIANTARAYVIQWFPEDSQCPMFYTMHRADTDKATYICSDVIPALAGRECWNSLRRVTFLEFSTGTPIFAGNS